MIDQKQCLIIKKDQRVKYEIKSYKDFIHCCISGVKQAVVLERKWGISGKVTERKILDRKLPISEYDYVRETYPVK